MSKAAVAAGADGLIIEIHPNPSRAVCDGAGSLSLDVFASLMDDVKKVAIAVDRRMA